MKRSEIIAALKAANIPFKGNAKNSELLALLPVKAEIMETETEKKFDHITFTIAIDQTHVEGGMLNQLKFHSEYLVPDGEVLNIRQIAGNFANKIFSAVKLLPKRSKGYNLSLHIDNQLVVNVRHKIDAKINFTNPVDMASGLLMVIASQFSTTNGEELFTSGVQNSGEVVFMAKKFGINPELPLYMIEKEVEKNRKSRKEEIANQADPGRPERIAENRKLAAELRAIKKAAKEAAKKESKEAE